MSYFLIGDLHLTDRPRDDYRFGIFDWIKEQQEIHQPVATFLMGDLTDQKDRHSSALVNRIVEGLSSIRPIFVIKGNHDYTDPENPFFGFLNLVEDIFFISNPELVLGGVAIIPHVRDEELLVANCKTFRADKPDLLLLHNTMQGAIAETGTPLTGFNSAPIRQLGPRLGCYAGDVHKPQTAGPVIYVGAPYHVRFGDDYEPRCLLVHDNGRITNLYFQAPQKHKLTIKDADEISKLDLTSGDHVKVTLELVREEIPEWGAHRQRILDVCEQLGLVVFGVDMRVNRLTKKTKTSVPLSQLPADVVSAFCKKEDVNSAVKEAGLLLVEE